MAEKSYKIDLDVAKVRSTSISRYNDGYNYASITSKVGESEYMSISYEWQGKAIPEFALMTMEIMKFAGNEKANLIEEDVFERASVHFKELAAKMKKKKEFKEWVKDKDTDNEEDMDEDKKKKKKEKEKEKK